ncbi:MAG: 8-amino-7-oxononanoate synthase [Leptonema sp. (in: Bacteria)]|nr:8-amino-7-oxononanoate synthase [Leptonema sp. (in: bacteria)]
MILNEPVCCNFFISRQTKHTVDLVILMTEIEKWAEFLNSAKLNRQKKQLLRTLETTPKNTIDFSSNDYLSLNHDGIVGKLFEQLLPITDFGSTGSRLIRGHRNSFELCEQVFADWVKSKSALLFHSGYGGNVGTMGAILDRHDLVFADRLCHASLLDGIRLSGTTRHYYRHNDLNHLEELLTKHSCKGRRFIITESVFSMDGDQPNLAGLIELANRHNALLFLDEAHAIGILGEGGRGLAAQHQHELAVISYPMGKAPGLMGCFIAGPEPLKSYLINHSRSFIYSTAQPPFLADLLRLIILEMKSNELSKRRETLLSISNFMHRRLNEEGLKTGQAPSHIVPIILGDEECTLRTAKYLRQNKFSVFAIRPPTVPQGECRLRICLHANNTEQQIEDFISALKQSLTA